MEKNKELIDNIMNLGYRIGQVGYNDAEHANKNLFNYRYWKIPEENYQLKHTPFYHDTEDDFIHFTSLDSLFAILNSKHLRLYNLLNMDDKFELEHARKALLFNNPDELDKEQLYCFSMCSSSVILNEEPKKKKHLLWKLHGRDGNGVIIRLKLFNTINSWYNYHLTKCFYNLDNFAPIKALHEITNNEFLDTKPACFNKLPIYEFENEIRLIFDNRRPVTLTDKDDKVLYPITYPDKLNKKDKIFYFQLPLHNFFKNNEEIYDAPTMVDEEYKIPKISITEIILGYRFSDADLQNIKDKIISYDPAINVKMSDLKQYY